MGHPFWLHSFTIVNIAATWSQSSFLLVLWNFHILHSHSIYLCSHSPNSVSSLFFHPWSPICAADVCWFDASWMCGLPPEHHQLTRDHTLKENFLSWEFSVSISSLPRSGPLCPPPSPRLDLGPFKHARILCRLSQPLWIYTCSCPEKLLLSVDGGCHRDPQLV